jgi:hypothetical protein
MRSQVNTKGWGRGKNFEKEVTPTSKNNFEKWFTILRICTTVFHNRCAVEYFKCTAKSWNTLEISKNFNIFVFLNI